MTEKYLVHSEISENEVLGLGMTGYKRTTALLLFVNLELVPICHLTFFTPKIGVLHGLLQGINSPCFFKFLEMGFNSSLTSGFGLYCF